MNQTKITYLAYSDESLMEVLTKGDSSAIEILYDRYFVKLCAYVYAAFQLPDAEDIVQDVFMKIIEKPQLYQSKYSFQTWIYTLTSNQSKNRRRNELKRGALNHFIPFEGHSFQQHNQLDVLKIKNAFEQVWNALNEKEKSIYVLKYEHHFGSTEIAEILGMPEGSVKSSLFYTLKKFARVLEPYMNHEK